MIYHTPVNIMIKLHRLRDEIKSLESRGLVKIENDTMTILCNEEEVRNRLLETGPWGALLLMGRLPEALSEILGDKSPLPAPPKPTP